MFIIYKVHVHSVANKLIHDKTSVINTQLGSRFFHLQNFIVHRAPFSYQIIVMIQKLTYCLAQPPTHFSCMRMTNKCVSFYNIMH